MYVGEAVIELSFKEVYLEQEGGMRLENMVTIAGVLGTSKFH